MLGRDSKAGRGVWKLYSRKKRRLQVGPEGGCWPGEAVGRLSRGRASYVIG